MVMMLTNSYHVGGSVEACKGVLAHQEAEEEDIGTACNTQALRLVE